MSQRSLEEFGAYRKAKELFALVVPGMRLVQSTHPSPPAARPWLPAAWLRGYSPAWLRLDVVAGLTAAAVVIPKAVEQYRGTDRQ
jgi:hypothetical protein